ncbi:MAG: hypothetical protein ACLFV0_00095 [Nitriliruptoraceae bacterium]
MDRTLRAALVAALLGFVTVAGLGVFLGFPTSGSVISGAVVGLLSGGLLLGAGRRADTFHPTGSTAHLADHRTDGSEDGPDTTDPRDAGDGPRTDDDPGATRG